jgi:hypothetical protein
MTSLDNLGSIELEPRLGPSYRAYGRAELSRTRAEPEFLMLELDRARTFNGNSVLKGTILTMFRQKTSDELWKIRLNRARALVLFTLSSDPALERTEGTRERNLGLWIKLILHSLTIYYCDLDNKNEVV